jgi:hypothetical protein
MYFQIPNSEFRIPNSEKEDVKLAKTKDKYQITNPERP